MSMQIRVMKSLGKQLIKLMREQSSEWWVCLVVDLHKIMTNVKMVELFQSSRLHRGAARLPGLFCLLSRSWVLVFMSGFWDFDAWLVHVAFGSALLLVLHCSDWSCSVLLCSVLFGSVQLYFCSSPYQPAARRRKEVWFHCVLLSISLWWLST